MRTAYSLQADQKLIDLLSDPERLDIDPNPFSSSRWYELRYPDVAAEDVAPLVHYCQIGWKENRLWSGWLDATWVQNTYGVNFDDSADLFAFALFELLQAGLPTMGEQSPLRDIRVGRELVGLGASAPLSEDPAYGFHPFRDFAGIADPVLLQKRGVFDSWVVARPPQE